MNVNDKLILDKLNNLIARERFSSEKILLIVGLAAISKNFSDLKENLDWETS